MFGMKIISSFFQEQLVSQMGITDSCNYENSGNLFPRTLFLIVSCAIKGKNNSVGKILFWTMA